MPPINGIGSILYILSLIFCIPAFILMCIIIDEIKDE